MLITREHADRIRELLAHGLVAGLGEPIPGQMCVEAAVCYAFGLPHSDNPPCVGEEVRKFKIKLNDEAWSSPQARAIGMCDLAIAQLGSDQIDQKAFRDLFWFRAGTQLQPLIWRYLATKGSKEARLVLADKMERSTTLQECKAHARTHIHIYDFDYGCDCGYAYGYGRSYCCSYGCGYGRSYNYGYSIDEWLTKVATVGVSVLRELNSPGVAFL